jgi:hypothetical protein
MLRVRVGSDGYSVARDVLWLLLSMAIETWMDRRESALLSF